MASRYFLAALLLISWVGCSTEIELNAPYQRTPVVFSLLDAAQDTQWVRINRTWLGDGNQLDAALVADSSEYLAEELAVEITERMNGADVQSWTLKDTVISNKSDEGIFYSPDQQMWFFVPEQGLDTDAEYDLDISILTEDAQITSSTNMIAEQIGNITQPPPGVNNFKLGFASVSQTIIYPDITFKWSSTEGASRYDIAVYVHVIERIWNDLGHTDLAEERERLIEWNIGTLNTENDEGGQVLQKAVSGERFYSILATKLEVDPYITRVLGVWDEDVQIVRAVDFVLTVANDELFYVFRGQCPCNRGHTGTSSIHQHQWRSGVVRVSSTQGVYGIGYTTASMQALREGNLTDSLNFCSPNPFSDYYCD